MKRDSESDSKESSTRQPAIAQRERNTGRTEHTGGQSEWLGKFHRSVGNQAVQRVDRKQQSGASTDDGGPEYVYLASGKGLTAAGMDRLERQTRELFVRHNFAFNDEWLVRQTEDGMKALLLRWQPSWGEPPSKWMGPEKLERFVRDRSTEKSYELAETSYSKETTDIGFTKTQQRWIREVMKQDEIAMLFRVLGGMPPVVLHRVKQFEKGQSAGATKGDEIAIAKHRVTPFESENDKIDTEKEFKGTLIHELLHFIENQTTGTSMDTRHVVPSDLINYLKRPEELPAEHFRENIFDEYAFGWFYHTGAKKWIHASANDWVVPEDIENADWEMSPMPVSGGVWSVEEDLAETMSLYFTDRRELLRTYPRRYKLMWWYFQKKLPESAK